MAKGKKTGGKNFPPGWKGGPGRPPVPADVKDQQIQIAKFREEARYRFAEAWAKLERMSIAELERFVSKENPETATVPVIELLLARLLLRLMNSGKPFDVNQVREMMCGPEPKQIELSGPGGEPLQPFQGVPARELIAVFQEVQKVIRESECKSTEKPPQLSELDPQSSVPSLPPPSGTES